MRRYEPKPWDIRRCDMVHADDGEYVRYDDAHAKIERLTKERDEARAFLKLVYSNNLTLEAELAGWKQTARQMEAERDEARAQVAAAYEAAAIRSENYARGAPYNQRASINALANSLRGMTSDHAQSALEARDREKVREGMRRAVDLYPQGIAAILAAMEKEGEE